MNPIETAALILLVWTLAPLSVFVLLVELRHAMTGDDADWSLLDVVGAGIAMGVSAWALSILL